MAEVRQSFVEFVGGILNRFLFWVPGFLLTLADLYQRFVRPQLPEWAPNVSFDPAVGVGLMIIGLLLAAFLTYHDLAQQTRRLAPAFKFLPEFVEVVYAVPAAGVTGQSWAALAVNFKNHSSETIRYQVEAIDASIGGITALNPTFANDGGIVGPGATTKFTYPRLYDVPLPAPELEGRVEWTLMYGLVGQQAVIRAHRRWAIFLLRTGPTDATVRHVAEAESEEEIRPTSRRLLRR